MRHNVFARVEPAGTRIRRFRFPRTGQTVNLLPAFLLSHRRGRVKSVSTQPVGRKAPNAWGLHDMLGSLWE